MEFLYSLSFPISITNISIGAHTMVICSRLITKVNTLRLSRCWNGWSCKRPNQASQMTIMGAYQKRSPQEVLRFPYFTVQIEALITGIAINWPNRIRFWKNRKGLSDYHKYHSCLCLLFIAIPYTGILLAWGMCGDYSVLQFCSGPHPVWLTSKTTLAAKKPGVAPFLYWFRKKDDMSSIA